MGLEVLRQGGSKKLEDAIRQRICSVCVDRNTGGNCALDASSECALFDSFPRIVQAVSGVQSELIDDYVAAIRSTVCSECVNQDRNGICNVREEVRCALDRYLLLIVEAIEEVQGIAIKRGASLQHPLPKLFC